MRCLPAGANFCDECCVGSLLDKPKTIVKCEKQQNKLVRIHFRYIINYKMLHQSINNDNLFKKKYNSFFFYIEKCKQTCLEEILLFNFLCGLSP